jgi:hypothetical protein
MDLRSCSGLYNARVRDFGCNHIRRCYEDLALLLNDKFHPETQKTLFEDILFKVLKGVTKLEIHRSYWIGKRNIDLFIPAVRANFDSQFQKVTGFKGLAIEVNGKIHDQYSKMMRDEGKYDLLHSLSICTVVIENHDFNHPLVKEILQNMSKYRNPDFRSKQRLLRNIHLVTLKSHKELIVENKLSSCISLLKGLGEL